MKKLFYFFPSILILLLPLTSHAFGLECEGFCVIYLFLLFYGLPIGLTIFLVSIFFLLFNKIKNRRPDAQLTKKKIDSRLIKVFRIGAMLGFLILIYPTYMYIATLMDNINYENQRKDDLGSLPFSVYKTTYIPNNQTLAYGLGYYGDIEEAIVGTNRIQLPDSGFSFSIHQMKNRKILNYLDKCPGIHFTVEEPFRYTCKLITVTKNGYKIYQTNISTSTRTPTEIVSLLVEDTIIIFKLDTGDSDKKPLLRGDLEEIVKMVDSFVIFNPTELRE